MADRSVPGLRILGRLVVLLVAAASLATGCRAVPVSFHAIPAPALSGDLATAERRAGAELSPAGYAAFLEAHDAYLAAWARTVRDEAEPLAREVRETGEDELRKDLGRIRRLVGRQKALLARFAALDVDLGGAIAGLGEHGPRISERFLALRSLDRVNAVLEADGGSVIADLRDVVDAVRRDPELEPLDPRQAADLAASLDQFEFRARPLRDAAAQAAIELAVDWRQAEDVSPPADSLVGAEIEGKDRENAVARIEIERTAAARGRLARALTRLADLDDAVATEIAAIDADFGEAVRIALLRNRTRDSNVGIAVRAVAFKALVASRSLELDGETRARIARERQEFLGADADQLRQALAIIREGSVPGVFEPGGPGAGGRRFERLRSIETFRHELIRAFDERLNALTGADLEAKLDTLNEIPRESLSASLAEIAGPARAGRLLAAVPTDFPQPPAPEPGPLDTPPEGPRERRIFLPDPIGPNEMQRFAGRCGLGATDIAAWPEILAAYRERRDASLGESGPRFDAALKEAVSSVMNANDPRRTSSSIARVFAISDEIRAARLAEDEALIADLAAAAARPPPAGELAFWRRERMEAARRVRWYDLPGGEVFRAPREATVDPATLAGGLDLSGADREAIAALLADYGVDVAAETLRSEWALALRRTFTLAVERDVGGGRFDPDGSPADRAELESIRRPLVAAGERVVRIHRQFLERIVARLPRDLGRGLREAYVEAAYPGWLDETASIDREIARFRADGRLEPGIAAKILVLLDARDEARDAALTDLLDWKDRVAGDRADGDESAARFRRDDPLFTLALVRRREADQRFARLALDLLDAEARERYGRLAEIGRRDVPSPSWIRTYD
jgi:hypothetical protein